MHKPNTPKLRFKEFTDEWQEKKLGDVLSCVVDNRGKTPELSKQGIPLIEVNAMGAKNIDYSVVNKYVDDETYSHWFRKHILDGDVLFSTVGKTAMCSSYDGKMKAAIAQNIVGLRANSQNSANFLYYLLIEPSNNHKFKKIEMTAVQPSVKVSQMIHLKFNLPEKPEQEKIANFLMAVDEKIGKMEEKKKGFEKYKKGVMQAIFSHGSTSSPQGKVRFKKPDGSNYPDWEEKKLGEIISVLMGQSPESSAYNENGDGLYLIQGNADISGRKTLPRFWTSSITKTCEIGDIILTVRAPSGYVAISDHKACIGRGVCAIKCKSENISGYIYQYLLWFEPRWVNIEQGSTFTAISGDDIKSLILLTPSREEQKKIAEFLTSLDNKVDLISKELEQTKLFKKSLLQQMFV